MRSAPLVTAALLAAFSCGIAMAGPRAAPLTSASRLSPQANALMLQLPNTIPMRVPGGGMPPQAQQIPQPPIASIHGAALIARIQGMVVTIRTTAGAQAMFRIPIATQHAMRITTGSRVTITALRGGRFQIKPLPTNRAKE
jgi:hypothetical protein